MNIINKIINKHLVELRFLGLWAKDALLRLAWDDPPLMQPSIDPRVFRHLTCLVCWVLDSC